MTPPGVPKVIDHRYLFNAAPMRPVIVVASAGLTDDWAAYAAGVDFWTAPRMADLDAVRQYGYKLTEAQARAFFPDIDGLEYRP